MTVHLNLHTVVCSVGIYQNDNMTDVCILYSMNIEGKCTVELASEGLTQAHPNYTYCSRLQMLDLEIGQTQ